MSIEIHPFGERGAPPERTAWLLHGILGSAKNWRSFARRLASLRPGWQIVPVDLRNHGEAAVRPGPHDLKACAEDLEELAAQLGGAPALIAGHSFGGKVAHTFAARAPEGLRQLWMLDTPPWSVPGGEVSGDVGQVLAFVAALPMPAESREQVRDAFIAAGFSVAIGEWMTTNLRRAADGYHWSFFLPGVQEMIRDYAQVDLTARALPAGLEVHLIRGARSDRWLAQDPRLAALESLSPPWHLHRLEQAGHWVHTDQPEALANLLAGGLEACERRAR
jgi:pimeloyl-ACP methyl ester carboxylesterase